MECFIEYSMEYSKKYLVECSMNNVGVGNGVINY